MSIDYEVRRAEIIRLAAQGDLAQSQIAAYVAGKFGGSVVSRQRISQILHKAGVGRSVAAYNEAMRTKRVLNTAGHVLAYNPAVGFREEEYRQVLRDAGFRHGRLTWGNTIVYLDDDPWNTSAENIALYNPRKIFTRENLLMVFKWLSLQKKATTTNTDLLHARGISRQVIHEYFESHSRLASVAGLHPTFQGQRPRPLPEGWAERHQWLKRFSSVEEILEQMRPMPIPVEMWEHK